MKFKRIITTHIQADFDCVASMLACHKLHPDYAMVFSGSQERAIRRYMHDYPNSFSFHSAKEVNENELEAIILVDTQTTTRLGKFNEVSQKRGLVKKVYDHHTETELHYKNAECIIKERGSTTTLMVELLLEKDLFISAEEANLFLLGIYQDTNSLTSMTTTKKDLQVVEKLLDFGGKPHKIATYLHDEMTGDEYALITTLLENLETVHIGGYRIHICTAICDSYIEGLATMANRIKRLYQDDITILIVEMGAGMHIVGRNRFEHFPLLSVFTALGGGGHQAACSVSLNSSNKRTVQEVKEEVIKLLTRQAPAQKTIQEEMTQPPLTIQIRTTILEAQKKFRLYGKSILPVLDEENIAGLLHQKDVEQAVRHNLGGLTVETIVDANFSVVYETDPIDTAHSLLIHFKQELLPVLKKEGNRLTGVMTKSDILETIYANADQQHIFKKKKDLTERATDQPKRKRSLASNVAEHFDKETRSLFEKIATYAEKSGMHAYLVGGLVRDLIIGRKNNDIDVVIEGDGIAFATGFAKTYGYRFKAHETFKTATVIVNGYLNFDVATARVEFYHSPAALPEVEQSSLKMDLNRRDFSINALALTLNKKHPYLLIDYFDAQRDIKEKKIRTLTKLSFVEDPTRAFRAVKFEQRLRFSLAKQTEKMLRLSVEQGHFKELSIKRIFNELLQILQEENPIWGIRRLEELHIPQVISSSLHVDDKMLTHLKQLRDLSHWFALQNIPQSPQWKLLYCNIFLRKLKANEKQKLVSATSLKIKDQNILLWHPGALKPLSELWHKRGYSIHHPQEAPFSFIYQSFSHLPLEVLLLYIENLPTVEERTAMAEYLRRLYSLKLTASGKEIAHLGIPPSPLFKTLQEEVIQAEIDNKIKTEEEKSAFLKERVAYHQKEQEGDGV